jgi:hypothetical protein
MPALRAKVRHGAQDNAESRIQEGLRDPCLECREYWRARLAGDEARADYLRAQHLKCKDCGMVVGPEHPARRLTEGYCYSCYEYRARRRRC